MGGEYVVDGPKIFTTGAHEAAGPGPAVGPAMSTAMTEDPIRAAAARSPRRARAARAPRDPVNLPMIRNWTEAIGGR